MTLFGAAKRADDKLRAQQRAAVVRPRDLMTPRQLAVASGTSRFKVLLVGRRGGKTIGCVLHAAEAMLDRPWLGLFLAKTIGSAREIMWEPWKRLEREHRWGFVFDHSKNIVGHPATGARMLVRGIDDREELEKLRGPSFDGIYIDECGTHKPLLLQYLVDEVLDATLMDRAGSTLWLAGTPTVQAHGFFFRASTGLDDGSGQALGYERHTWTAESNPHVDFRRHVYDERDGVLRRKGWTTDTPAFRREYLAEWIVETERRVFRFDRARNWLEALPELRTPRDAWFRVLALDFGVNDATACVRLATPKLYGRGVYVERSWSRRGLAPSDAADLIARDIDEYKPDAVVGDSGGLGKAYLQEFAKRYPGLRAIEPAEKTEKRASLELCSDALHAARGVARGGASDDIGRHEGLFIVGADARELQRQLASLLWDDGREDIAEGQDDDEAMALVYGFRRMRSYRNAQRPPPRSAEAQFMGWGRDSDASEQQRSITEGWIG